MRISLVLLFAQRLTVIVVVSSSVLDGLLLLLLVRRILCLIHLHGSLILVNDLLLFSRHIVSKVSFRRRPDRGLLQLFLFAVGRSDRAASVYCLITYGCLRVFVILNMRGSCGFEALRARCLSTHHPLKCSRSFGSDLVVTVQLDALCLSHLVLLSFESPSQTVEHTISELMTTLLLRPLGRGRVRGRNRRLTSLTTRMIIRRRIHVQLQLTSSLAAQLRAAASRGAFDEATASSSRYCCTVLLNLAGSSGLRL